MMKPVWVASFRDRPLGELSDYLAFVLVFFMLPFVVVLPAHDGFITAKWSFLGVGLFVVGSIHFWRAVRGRDFIVPLTVANLLLLLFWLWKLLGIAWAGSFRLALESFAQVTIVVCFAILSQSILYQERRRIVTLGVILSIAGGLISLWVLVLDFLRAFGNSEGLVMSRLFDWRDQLAIAGFGNTGHISDFIVVSFLFTLISLFFVMGMKRIFFVCILLWLQASALIVCWSLHSVLSLIISSALLGTLLVLRWRRAPRFWSRLPRLGIAVAGWIAVTCFYVVDHPLNPHQTALWKSNATAQTSLPGIFGHAFSSARWQDGGVTREAIWLTSFQMFVEHPLIGVGTGNFTYVYPVTTTPAVLNNPELQQYAYRWTNAAHQLFLQQASESGLIGLLLILGLIGTAVFELIKRLRVESTTNHIVLSGGLCALVALTLQGQMNFVLELPVSSFLFFLLLGLPAVVPKRGVVIDLVMPVTRPFGPFEAGVMMKNMRTPTALILMGSLKGFSAVVYGVFLIAVVAYGSLQAVKPLRASMEYKPLYEEMRHFYSTGILANKAETIAQAEGVLNLNPGHRECRAHLIELLLINPTAQEIERANVESLILGKTLQDAKQLRLRALVLEAAGKPVEALPYWDLLFTRYPEERERFASYYREWLKSKPPTTSPTTTKVPSG